MARRSGVTEILQQASAGSDSAVNRLMPLVYDELRALAASHLKQERADHTLQATALVHEAYVRLVHQDRVDLRGRAHFFAVAAQAIRRILVDHARQHSAAKRGGDRQRVDLSDDEAQPVAADENLLALVRLGQLRPRQAQIVELRLFGGLTLPEIAAHLGVSSQTVDGDWHMARAWLHQQIRESRE